jgi:hypothetical protein
VVTGETANETGLSYGSALSPQYVHCHTAGQQLLVKNQIQQSLINSTLQTSQSPTNGTLQTSQSPTNGTLQTSQSHTNGTLQTSQSPTNGTLQMSLCETAGSLPNSRLHSYQKMTSRGDLSNVRTAGARVFVQKGCYLRGDKGRFFYTPSSLKLSLSYSNFWILPCTSGTTHISEMLTS